MVVEAETEGRGNAHQDSFYVFFLNLMSYGRYFVLAGRGRGGGGFGIFRIFRTAAHII
jgi:hypothetical protein